MNAKRIWLLCALVPMLCVSVVACGNGTEVVRVEPTMVPPSATDPVPTLAPAPLITPLPTPTEPVPTLAPEPPTVTLTPEATRAQPVATATESVTAPPSPTEPSPDEKVLDDLAKELLVSFGGAGGYCGEVPDGPLPAVTGHVMESHSGWICLWGFSPGASVGIELYDPSGRLAAARQFTVDREEEGVGLVEILVSFAGRPAGSWTILANSVNARLEAPFLVSEPRRPVISVLPAASDLFTGHGPMEWPKIPYIVGEQLAIYGAGFPPDRSLPLGIYLLRETDTDAFAGLLDGLVVQVDAQGRFVVRLPIEDVALLGENTYLAIIQLDPSYQPMAFGFDAGGAIGGFYCVLPGP